MFLKALNPSLTSNNDKRKGVKFHKIVLPAPWSLNILYHVFMSRGLDCQKNFKLLQNLHKGLTSEVFYRSEDESFISVFTSFALQIPHSLIFIRCLKRQSPWMPLNDSNWKFSKSLSVSDHGRVLFGRWQSPAAAAQASSHPLTQCTKWRLFWLIDDKLQAGVRVTMPLDWYFRRREFFTAVNLVWTRSYARR